MKIAYLILAHKDPDFVKRVSFKLTKNTNDHVFIHIDGKAEIKDFTNKIPGNEQIHFINQRVNVYWGGFSSIEATIRLYEAAFNYDHFNYFMILQGLDYPLWSNKEIHSFFEKRTNVEYIRAINDTLGEKSQWLRYIPKYHLDGNGLMNKFYNRFQVEKYKIFKNFYKAPYVASKDQKLIIYRGWAHFAITNKCVEYILEFYYKNDEYNEFFKHVYAADESYFHTIIFNSKFVDKTIEGGPIEESKRSIESLLNLTYFEYPKYVTEFTKKEDYYYLLDKGYPFFRKVSSNGQELLDFIDKETDDIKL